MDIIKTLHTAPGTIAKLGQELEDERELWMRHSLDVEQKEAKLYLKLKAENPKLTVKELEMLVIDSAEITEEKRHNITFECAFRKKEHELKSWYEASSNARTLAKHEMARMSNLQDSV